MGTEGRTHRQHNSLRLFPAQPILGPAGLDGSRLHVGAVRGARRGGTLGLLERHLDVPPGREEGVQGREQHHRDRIEAVLPVREIHVSHDPSRVAVFIACGLYLHPLVRVAVAGLALAEFNLSVDGSDLGDDSQ